MQHSRLERRPYYRLPSLATNINAREARRSPFVISPAQAESMQARLVLLTALLSTRLVRSSRVQKMAHDTICLTIWPYNILSTQLNSDRLGCCFWIGRRRLIL